MNAFFKTTIVLLALLFAGVSCNTITQEISLDRSDCSLIAGESETLHATVAPTEPLAKIIWSSSDASVATVSDGKVTAIKEGTVTISAGLESGAVAKCLVTVVDKGNYLCFETKSGVNHLKIKNLKSLLEYSYNGSSWSLCLEDKSIEFGNGVKLYLRGSGNNTGDTPIAQFYFEEEELTKVYCSGNIMSLLDSNPIATAITREYCFKNLFDRCRCLTTAPELPAKTLAQGCYEGMFNLCRSLEAAPELPATQLEPSCYCSMFSYCNSLTEAPALPAENLADNCYEWMFQGCTLLAEAPALPAKTLKKFCYQGMFDGCGSLTKAPELPATELLYRCYYSMFLNCTELNYVKAMFVSVPEGKYDDYLKVWLKGVAASGKFVKNKAATWDNESVIPNGWTIETAE